jgi:hypothetical protein
MPSVDTLSPLISVSSSCVYKDSFLASHLDIVTTSLHTLVIASFVTYRRVYFQQIYDYIERVPQDTEAVRHWDHLRTEVHQFQGRVGFAIVSLC